MFNIIDLILKNTTFNIPNISDIVTSVNTNVSCKGNGKTFGITDGVNTGCLWSNSDALTYAQRGGYGDTLPSSNYVSNFASSKNLGVTTDATKSGIVGTVTRTQINCNYIIKY